MMTNERKSSRLIRFALLGIILLGLCDACTPYRGYGVLVWKNEDLPFPVGELLNIASIFNVDNYYEVDFKGARVQVPMWQVQFFEKLDEAKKFQTDFLPYANLYVFTLKAEGLPLRSGPQSTANAVYKLRTGVVAKAIGRDKERTKIDRMNDYWYWVLTEDGTRGYVYGHFLETIESASNKDEKLLKLIEADPALERFLKNTWLPIKTAEMLRSGRIDVKYLEKKYSLTPKPDENRIILNSEDLQKEYSYTSIKKISGDTYEFGGTDLKVQIFPSEKIYVSFFLNAAYTTKEFVMAEKDMGEIISSESQRSQNILLKFINRGSTLSSDSYGTITLNADYGFTWKDFSALKSILPPVAAGQGTVNFNRYLSRAAAGSTGGPYEGAISFVFNDFHDVDVTFAYTFDGTGVKFVYVARENIDTNEIRRLGSSPLVLFFNFVK